MMKREKAAEFIKANVLGSNDVQEMLKVNRSRLAAMVEAGQLIPIKELKREKLFWLPDVEKLKSEMILDTRTNLYKMEGLKDEQ
ncbi:DNA-binding protein [Bacillus sp. ISL-75]|uniref:DNA-binding protein n=1 Tax=Bacillus sp. ISL-75 TaxID=2819137 RepID=UPI001BE51949|nr:DNA-binding protein [Bacillus sp. ISL-75]MBT2728414.1 DNA-binding protein [Bacillus sp. ISL-75]